MTCFFRRKGTQVIKHIVRKSFEMVGLEISRLHQAKTTNGALARSTKRHQTVQTVIDVGASDGRWSRMCMRHFPNANYLLIEAQSGHMPGLERFSARYTKASYIIAAASSSVGEIYFDSSELFGGLAFKTPRENSVSLPAVTVDSEVTTRNLEGPFLLKLDTHGFEVPILEGAKETLKNASLVIIEAYNFQLTTESLKFYEMCQYMENLGFRCLEVVDLMIRPKDGAFWQMDLIFAPANLPLFKDNAYGG